MIALFLTGLFAGTVDAIAGGGGLISLPVLLGMGMPPHLAFGTNKLQGTIGTFMAARRYHQQGWISLSSIKAGIIAGVIGASLGAITGQILSTAFLQKVIPLMLLAILLYTIFSPRMGMKDANARMPKAWFFLLFGFALSFYDGFFGPGVGSFWVFWLTYLLGFNLVKATAYTKIFNLNSSFVALVCFAIGGNIDYKIGLCMAAGQLIGGRLGANLAIKSGAKVIRPIFLFVVSGTILTLMYKSYVASPYISHLTAEHHLLPFMLILGVGSLATLTAVYVRFNVSENTVSSKQ